MSPRTIAISSLALTLSLLGCKGDEEPPKAGAAPAGSAAATTVTGADTAAAAGAGKCGTLGCTGKGDFSDMCDCKGKHVKPPFEVKATGKYSSFANDPEFEITNTSDKDIHWASAAVYYYDKSGKQLEAKINDKIFKASRINGSNFSFKPKETKTIHFGFKKDREPDGIDTMQVVFDGWCFGTYDDKASHLCVSIERPPEERPRSN